ncbi:MAG TPA: right-handed parallel beta-helix repeat-containing protein, partial [Actinomycetota bacterium]
MTSKPAPLPLVLVRILVAAAVLGAATLAVGSSASAHPERKTYFPDPQVCYGGPPCHVPAIRTSGPFRVVCKPDSGRRLRHEYANDPAKLDARLELLKKCRYSNIQDAVNAAHNGDRILIMPGVYKEEPSRNAPFTPKQCSGASYFDVTEGNNPLPPPVGPTSNDPPIRPNYKFQHDCPNARNLIAIIGDANQDRRCDSKCNLQLQGMGRRPEDVDIQGDRVKMDVIRGDRADGLVITHLTVEFAAFNGIDVVEINGFRFQDVVARWNQDYGILSFTADHGLYDTITAYGNGDSGVYPGSTAKGCVNDVVQRYPIELRHINSYGNVLGYSGTAGNSTWIHDSRFHDNSSGISTDSFASGHPGFPQECVKWEHNLIYSNNFNPFYADNQNYCRTTPFPDRNPHHVCPQFEVPVGSGIIIYGGDRNLIRRNHIYDNWRSGLRLYYIPAVIRGDDNPADQTDTSNGNQILNNMFGITPDGRVELNGFDVTWDDAGSGNCFQGNRGTGNGLDPNGITAQWQLVLPTCPGRPVWAPPNPLVSALDVPCAAWDPMSMPNPPGCSWFTTPTKPSRSTSV